MTNTQIAARLREMLSDQFGAGRIAMLISELAAELEAQPAGEAAVVAPVQGYSAGIPWSLHLEAYDEYRKRHGAQPALIDLAGRNCRGGFGTRELDEYVPGWRERVSQVTALRKELGECQASYQTMEREVAELRAKLNEPELRDFAAGVVQEAAHQRERWDSGHDAGKEPQDWFWLLGYLGGKALKAHASGDVDKALHHCISSAAALANWHAAISGAHAGMRPGIDPVARGIGES